MLRAFKSLLRQSFWQRSLPVLIIVLSFNVVVQFSAFRENLPFIHRAQLGFHRFLCSLVPRPVSAKWVRTVEIDDALHQKLGEPTDRNFLAALVENAVRGDAAAVVLDFKLVSPPGYAAGRDEPQRQAPNLSLMKAIQTASVMGVPVVVPCWLRQAEREELERRPNIYLDSDLPLPDENGQCQRVACARLGNINVPTDERQIPLVTLMSARDPCATSLGLAATAAYEDTIERSPKTRDKKIISRMIGDKRFVFGSFIREGDFQKISGQALKDGEQGAIRSCRGRIVLIGGKWHSDMGTGELVDRYDTPVGPMQGMYLHANYIEALLDDRYQREVPILFGLGFDLVVGGALYYFFHKAHSTRGRVFVLGVFLAPLVASYIVFANLNLYLDFILPLSACFVHLVVEIGRDYLHLTRPSNEA